MFACFEHQQCICKWFHLYLTAWMKAKVTFAYPGLSWHLSSKDPSIVLRLTTTWNTAQCKGASFFLLVSAYQSLLAACFNPYYVNLHLHRLFLSRYDLVGLLPLGYNALNLYESEVLYICVHIYLRVYGSTKIISGFSCSTAVATVIIQNDFINKFSIHG